LSNLNVAALRLRHRGTYNTGPKHRREEQSAKAEDEMREMHKLAGTIHAE
jgi:hypothetical protein